MNGYCQGNLEADRAAELQRPGGNEWLVGAFNKFASDPDRKSTDLEVKYAICSKNKPMHPAKVQPTVTEFTLVLEGATKGWVGSVDNEVELKAGDYILIQPGTENNLVTDFKEGTKILTVKAPSKPGDGQKLPQ